MQIKDSGDSGCLAKDGHIISIKRWEKGNDNSLLLYFEKKAFKEDKDEDNAIFIPSGPNYELAEGVKLVLRKRDRRDEEPKKNDEIATIPENTQVQQVPSDDAIVIMITDISTLAFVPYERDIRGCS